MFKAVIAIAVALSPASTCAFAPSISGGRAASTSSVQMGILDDIGNAFGGAVEQAAGVGGAKKGQVAVIAGATGYIGKSTVRESVRQGYKTIALVRDKSKVESDEGKMLFGQYFEGAEVVECDVCDADKLTETLKDISTEAPGGKIDAILQ